MNGSPRHAERPFSDVAVAAALLALLAVTVLLAHTLTGALALVAALLIAGAKAALVLVCFMHVRAGAAAARLFAGAGVFLLTIMIGFAVAELLTRI